MKKNFAIKIIPLFLCLLLGLPQNALSQDDVPKTKLKEEFFSGLNKKEKISLLETLDRGKRLTSFELGAKYRWGSIPPDRRPPASLAQWWKSLSQRQKDKQRLKWFEKHYSQIDLDRAARELHQQDRLTKIYRRLENELNQDASELESVPFPGESVGPPEDSPTDTEFNKIYKQEKDDEEENATPTDSTPPPEGVEPESSESTESSQSSNTDKSEKRVEKESVEDVTSEKSKKTENDSKVRKFGQGNVYYRRVGDHIEIIERKKKDRTQDRSDAMLNAKNSDTSIDVDQKTYDSRSESGATSDKTLAPQSGEINFPGPSLRTTPNQVDPPPLRKPTSNQ